MSEPKYTDADFNPDWGDYGEDPELGDEKDPAYMEEIFSSYKHMGWEPEQLKDPADQQEYRNWLKKNRSKPK